MEKAAKGLSAPNCVKREPRRLGYGDYAAGITDWLGKNPIGATGPGDCVTINASRGRAVLGEKTDQKGISD